MGIRIYLFQKEVVHVSCNSSKEKGLILVALYLGIREQRFKRGKKRTVEKWP